MRVIFFLLAFLPGLLFAQSAKENRGVTYDVVITRVVDGDTVAFRADWLPEPLKKELSIRVFGVDTPEKGHRARCPQEAQRGEQATAFTKQVVSSAKKRQIVLMDWDKYGGRVLGSIILDGVDLRTELIRNGFAVPYFGDKKEHDWCK
jgi:endonuclease YncB( thermonuclease family)